jgi:hypothetical protein
VVQKQLTHNTEIARLLLLLLLQRLRLKTRSSSCDASCGTVTASIHLLVDLSSNA